MASHRALTLAAPVSVLASCMLATACASGDPAPRSGATPSSAATSSSAPPPPSSSDPRPSATSSAPTPTRSARPSRPPRREPRTSYLSIPALGLRGLAVVRYRGTTDDGPGTVIQNEGSAASPRGPRGGVGPGRVGNYLVTGHRTSHGAPFGDLPALGNGALVRVRSAGTVFVYRVSGTREVSFRSASSLRAQRAAVPGRPGMKATRAMITLSTCATPEDHAEGNYWSDEFGNPEHRIDKIGVLVDTRAAG